MATAMPPSENTAGPTSRVTNEGRRIWYKLQVIQEPERARACGSGAKSTTDRRPVDPPPVCQLRIFEGETFENATDITFQYNANFFLYTHLETARPIAHGRVNTPATNSPPVLTGIPVSGMAYLDRPEAAGYFLFPDVSVRHEGRYKFTFNLFEQTKEEKDKNPGDDGEEKYIHVVRVESNPFSVHSAKKFPGLSESTTLSRIISEQGCRVRIRRDVRMRRRETKPSSTADYEQKDEYRRRQRTQTPEIKPDLYRQRSLSNSSVDRAPYPDPHQYRRGSASEYGVPPPSTPPAYGTPGPQTPSHPGNHLQFGHSAPQYAAPPPPPPPPAHHQQQGPPQPQAHYPPPPSPTSARPSHYQTHQHVPPPSRQYPMPQPPRSYVQTPPPQVVQEPIQRHMTPLSIPQPPPPQPIAIPQPPPPQPMRQPHPPHPAHAAHHNHSMPQSRSMTPVSRREPPSRIETGAGNNVTLPPIQDSLSSESPRDRLSIQGLCEAKSRGLEQNQHSAPHTSHMSNMTPSTMLPPIQTHPSQQPHISKPPAPLVVDDDDGYTYQRSTNVRDGKKRNFEETFNNIGAHQRLNNRRRQEDPHMRDRQILPGQDEPAGGSNMMYRAANGKMRAWEL